MIRVRNIIIIVGFLLVFLAFIFPPFKVYTVYVVDSQGEKWYRVLDYYGHAFLLSPPVLNPNEKWSINWASQIVIISIIAVVTIVGVILTNLSGYIKIGSPPKIIIIVGLILALLACIYPPWKIYPVSYSEWKRLKLGDSTRIVQQEYAFLFNGPELYRGYVSYSIDWARLSVELITIGLLAGIVVMLTWKKDSEVK